MATFKIRIRDDRPNGRGECPLYLRITHNRKKRYKKLDVRIEPKYWNAEAEKVRRSHPRHKTLNIQLDRIIGKAKQAVASLDVVSAESIKNYLNGISKEQFFPYAERFAEGLAFHDRRNVQSALKSLRAFRSDLAFTDLTPQLFEKWDRWMARERRNKRNTRSTYIRKVGRVMNHAMKHDVIGYEHNPFALGKINLRWEDPEPTKLLPEELKAFTHAELPKKMQIWRDLFLFALYNDGMRVTDVLLLRDSNVADGVLTYRMSKNGKVRTIAMASPALKIWNRYSGPVYHFPLIRKDYKGDRLNREIKRVIALTHHRLNKIAKLVGIDKKLGMHVARHTFAYLADDNGWSLTEIQNALDHSSVTETRDYIGRIRADRLTKKRKDLFK